MSDGRLGDDTFHPILCADDESFSSRIGIWQTMRYAGNSSAGRWLSIIVSNTAISARPRAKTCAPTTAQ